LARAVTLNSRDALAAYEWGRALWALGERERAEAAWKTAISMDPRFLMRLGAELRPGIPGELVVELARAAITAGWHDVFLYGTVAGYYQNQGDLEMAKAWYEQARQTNPTSWIPPREIADLLMLQKRYPEAIVYWKEATRKDPRHPHLPFAMGLAYAAMGQWQEAIAAYSRSIELHPSRTAFIRLAEAYTQIGDYEKANEAYQRAAEIESNPGD